MEGRTFKSLALLKKEAIFEFGGVFTEVPNIVTNTISNGSIFLNYKKESNLLKVTKFF